MIISRDVQAQSPRDNVLLELGLFIGGLGRERTFVVFNRDEDIKLPSDLAGVSMAEYGNRQDRNLLASLGPACTKIRYAIKSHGSRPLLNEKSFPKTNPNQPFVTAKVTTEADGNISTCLNLNVQNTGGSPAKNIRLGIDKKNLDNAIENDSLKSQVSDCFTEKGMIPILENGQFVSNSFGYFNIDPKESTWKIDSILDVAVSYQDLEGNFYEYSLPLKIASDSGFAGSWWGKAE